jgi:hypothetical protein
MKFHLIKILLTQKPSHSRKKIRNRYQMSARQHVFENSNIDPGMIRLRGLWQPPVSHCLLCCILSFGWFPGIWVLYADVSEHSVCSFFIGGVSRKNNREEIVGVFIRVKVWLKNSLSQSAGGTTGRGRVWVEKQAVAGKDHKWRPVVRMWWRNVAVSGCGGRAMGW